MTDKTRIIEYARRLGFNDLKFAKAEPLEKEYADYEDWISGGFQGDMHFLENNKEKRRDIRNILPDAKTVIVMSHLYRVPLEHNNDNTRGKIAKYAWGDDYHEALGDKAKLIKAFIEKEHPQTKCMHYIDTGPILEKSWAVKAGLGWKGKNSLVVNKNYGSFFFITVIITSLEIEADEPVAEHCGTCTKCIDACPTGAIFEPRKVDATKCIPYWTIEVKAEKEIPDEIAKNLEGYVFGCDICQNVCPWNKKRKEYTSEELFQPRNNLIDIPLEEATSITHEEYKRLFGKTALKRTKAECLNRNANALLKFRNK